MHQKSIHLNRGFTLIELMVTIAVLAIILGFAIPSFTDQIRNNRSLAYGEEFVTALNFARSEAIKRGGVVSICPSNDDADGCDNDWSNGWLVFVDSEDEISGSTTIGELLRVWDAVNEEMTLTVERDGAANFLRFNQRGSLSRDSEDSAEITAMHSECTANSAREINVLPSGSVRSRRVEC